jgi:hypothetical protein
LHRVVQGHVRRAFLFRSRNGRRAENTTNRSDWRDGEIIGVACHPGVGEWDGDGSSNWAQSRRTPSDNRRGDEKERTGGQLGSEGKDGKKSASKPKESVGRRIMNKLPKWLSDSLVDVRTWKTFTRCMIATFGAMVLMLAQPCEWGLELDSGHYGFLGGFVGGFDLLGSGVSEGREFLLLCFWVLVRIGGGN